MKDIALLAGVSRQAVSAVLNGNGSSRVSEENREKILRISKEVNYIPNSAALSLKGAPSNIIGFMAPIMGTGVCSSLIDEISEILIAKGYNILYNDYNWSNYNATKSLLSLVARGVDGIIIYNSDEEKTFDTNQTVPYLFCSHNNHDFMDVGVDNEYGGYLATKHLLDHGHKKVAFMSVHAQGKKNARYRGWLRAHNEAGIQISESDVIILRDFNGDANSVVNYLREKSVTAVFSFNDFIGIKLIKILTQRGIRVPDDIAVIGYNGYTFTESFTPSLTTIIQPIRPQAEFGVDLLLSRIKNKELHSPPANHFIKPILFKGESCGCKVDPINNFFRINNFNMLEKDYKMNFDIDLLNNNN